MLGLLVDGDGDVSTRRAGCARFGLERRVARPEAAGNYKGRWELTAGMAAGALVSVKWV